MILTGAQIVLEVLLDHGVDTVFGYPGGTILNVYDEFYKNSDRIHHVLTAHEQGAAHAADGYARSTGKTGVVFSTSGPGATNLVTGIAAAYMDSSPVVAITANVPNEQIGGDAFQEIHITGITLPITKHNYFINDIDDLEDALRNAFRIANSGRKGPVLVDITKDVTAAKTEFTNKPPLPLKAVPTVQRDEVIDIVRMINNAEKPVAYIGGGCNLSEAFDEVREFSEKADIPIVHTLMATGVVSSDMELNLGLIGMHGTVASNRAVDQADLIIALGARFSDRVALDPKRWGRKAKIVQVDIDKSELGKNVPIDVSCYGDVKDFLRKALPYITKNEHKEWHDRVVRWKTKERVERTLTNGVDPKEYLQVISDLTDEETIFTTDVGQHQMWAAQYLKQKKPKKFITSGGLGAMGFGYGAAIGSQFGNPDKRVIHITGDASLHMNMAEACTAVSNNLPIITIIFNNGILGMVYQLQTFFYGGRHSETAPNRKTDFVKIAEGFGAKGLRARTVEEFRSALTEALQTDGPVWIDCVIEQEERVLPMIPGGKSVDEIIVE
ncbi:MAG: biosynthetic-type acetolactate synthase large subunit [Anaerovoracaceae bacterium]|jgi:acetolactate synthase-1/2/3 large subunit